MKIDIKLGGGAYYLTEMKYGNEPTEFMCLFSGQGGDTKFRERVTKLHEKKNFKQLYETYIYPVFEKDGNYREITMREEGGWWMREEAGRKAGGYT